MKHLLSTASGAALLAGVVVHAPAQAAVTMYSTESAWDTAVFYHVGTTVTGDADTSTPSSITLGAGSVLGGLAGAATTHIVGTDWATWPGQPGSNGTTVYYNPSTSLTMSFAPGSIFAFSASHAVDAFGMYIEPVDLSTFNITMTLSGGSTLTQSVNGSGGAQFFGWVGPGVTSITIGTTDTNGFGFGQFSEGSNISGVPEPTTLAVLGVGLIGAAFARRKRA